ncbi:hypothetical protein C5B42_00290 [Candidatus Cerribacteria bacterium 'Amazon FNV 2010 28 9']|uniref:Uncharacterized protein n=1 Tax=Candidatus Cerribacteria bacterium 'Amazon FNV 2010 28 9' TaxID=2081795 RepID=A0A317JVB9_9BACT|nr:MAG: hypothetical protein C5B42_00290 [Candidatus Cerribacteria bacterium 'Amazon FNV 2010 28 9']
MKREKQIPLSRQQIDYLKRQATQEIERQLPIPVDELTVIDFSKIQGFGVFIGSQINIIRLIAEHIQRQSNFTVYAKVFEHYIIQVREDEEAWDGRALIYAKQPRD